MSWEQKYSKFRGCQEPKKIMHENEKLIGDKLPFGREEEKPQTNLTQTDEGFMKKEGRRDWVGNLDSGVRRDGRVLKKMKIGGARLVFGVEVFGTSSIRSTLLEKKEKMMGCGAARVRF
jgi:hypothetical protein